MFSLPTAVYDRAWLVIYITYLTVFTVVPVYVVVSERLPFLSSVIVVCEQLRFFMKVYAFVRENAPRALSYKAKSEGVSAAVVRCPDFGRYLYFLFSPTLVYRDDYPRSGLLCHVFVMRVCPWDVSFAILIPMKVDSITST